MGRPELRPNASTRKNRSQTAGWKRSLPERPAPGRSTIPGSIDRGLQRALPFYSEQKERIRGPDAGFARRSHTPDFEADPTVRRATKACLRCEEFSFRD